MRLAVTACLAGATFLFLLGRSFEDRHGLFLCLKIFGEAAMIGGLADWFAVTALFRHPLGLPIPHTAIIPRRKDEIGRQLGEFIRERFLSTPNNPLLIEKIRSLKMGHRITEWFVKKENAELIVRQLSHTVGRTLAAMREEDFSAFLNLHVTQYIRRHPIAPHLAQFLAVLRAEQRHQKLIDEGLRIADDLIQKNIPLIQKLIQEGTPRWTLGLADRYIFNLFITRASGLLSRVASDPRHPLRERFDAYFEDLIHNLRHDPETIGWVEAAKAQVLDNPKIQEVFSAFWPGLQATLVQACREEPSSLRAYVERFIVDAGGTLRSDPAMMGQFNEALEEAALQFIDRDGREVSSLISDTVASWDTETTTRQVELLMGDDLQFVRINGTVVGGLAGLAIYGLSVLLEKGF